MSTIEFPVGTKVRVTAEAAERAGFITTDEVLTVIERPYNWDALGVDPDRVTIVGHSMESLTGPGAFPADELVLVEEAA